MPTAPGTGDDDRQGKHLENDPWNTDIGRHNFGLAAVVLTLAAVVDAFFAHSGGAWPWFHYLGDATLAAIAGCGWHAGRRYGRTSEQAAAYGYLLDTVFAVVWTGYFLQSVQAHHPNWLYLFAAIGAAIGSGFNRRGRDKVTRALGYKARAALAKLAGQTAAAPVPAGR